MELVYSSVIPLKPSGFSSFRETFERQLVPANDIKIATGYVSEESLMELKAILSHYNANFQRITCDLVIGMHGREGFTQPQHEAACSLGKFLRDEKIGEVRVCTAFKFHGKIYSFLKDTAPQASIVGSSNLSDILGLDLQWETDILLTESVSVKRLIELHHNLVLKATKPILEYSDYKIIQRSDLLEGRTGVEKISSGELEKLKTGLTRLSFNIPLKAEQKSNLNVYFGKGRETSTTKAIRPRAWYEVEVIVSHEITKQRGYPKADEPFTVYTDDGWKFRCKVSGQNNKNFRSEDDLQTLGRWIKGRMEANGVLKVGELVTPSMLQKYGKENLVLTATRNPHVWFLDFSRNL
jgi:hypothetical protein